MDDKKVRIVAALLFDDVEPLDLFGPIQAFKRAVVKNESNPEQVTNLYKIFTIAQKKEIVDIGGIDVFPKYSFADAKSLDFDILLIPGGYGTRSLVDNDEFIQGLKQLCRKADIIASVCTGSAFLAKAGLLYEKQATTNKKAWAWVTEQGPAKWCCPRRWINLIDSNKQGIITSAGVSAGTDMSIALINELNGAKVVRDLLETMEYNWNNDPKNDCYSYLCPSIQ